MPLLLMLLILIGLPDVASAQTVSIISLSGGNETMIVETAMKQLLREEGFTVKSETGEGIIMLSVLENESQGRKVLGYTGHIALLSVQWQNLADSAVSENCRESHATAQQIKDYLGIRNIYLDSTMAASSSSNALANMLVTHATHTIRKTARKMQAFFEEG